MNHQISAQLDKVLALADSSHDGEAVVAVRKAREMLSRNGISFSDLARAATPKPRIPLPFGFLTTSSPVHDQEISALRQQLIDLQTELTNQTTLAEFWHRRAVDLEQNLNLSQAEVIRWKELAQETVEKLWELGSSLEAQDGTATTIVEDQGRKIA